MFIQGYFAGDQFKLIEWPLQSVEDLRLQKRGKNILYYRHEELIQISQVLGLRLKPELPKAEMARQITRRLAELNRILSGPVQPSPTSQEQPQPLVVAVAE